MMSHVNLISRDYPQIYAHLMDSYMSTDHALLLRYLDELRCKSWQDLEFLDDVEFDRLLGFMRPGIPTKKLKNLLNRPY